MENSKIVSKSLYFSDQYWDGTAYIKISQSSNDNSQSNYQIYSLGYLSEQNSKKDITYLHLNNTEIEDLNFLPDFENLEFLDISFCNKIKFDVNDLIKINAIKKLKTLRADGTSLSSIDILKLNTCLDAIHLKGCPITLSSDFKEIIINAIYLKLIDLKDCPVAKELPEFLVNNRNALNWRSVFINEKIRSENQSLNLSSTDTAYKFEKSLAEIIVDEYFEKSKKVREVQPNILLDLGKCGLSDIDFILSENSKSGNNNDNKADEKKRPSFLDFLLSKKEDLKSVKRISIGKGFFFIDGKYEESTNYLEENSFSKLPLLPFPNLEELVIRNARLETITNLDKLTKITELDLSSNLISKIEGIEQNKKLIELALHDNKILEVPILNLPKLKTLYLSKNNIKNIDNIFEEKALTELYLNENQIDSLPITEAKCVGLKKIYLQNNLIKQISLIGQFKELESFDLSNNLVEDIPESVLNSKSGDFLRKYLNSIQQSNKGKIKINTRFSRMFILGDNAEYCESLFHTLGNGKDEFNCGQDIVKLFYYNNMELAYGLHRLTIDADGIFVVLWSQDDKSYGLEYWLQTIQMLPKDSKAIKVCLIQVSKSIDDVEAVNKELVKNFRLIINNHINIDPGTTKINDKDYEFKYFQEKLCAAIEEQNKSEPSFTSTYYALRDKVLKAKDSPYWENKILAIVNRETDKALFNWLHESKHLFISNFALLKTKPVYSSLKIWKSWYDYSKALNINGFPSSVNQPESHSKTLVNEFFKGDLESIGFLLNKNDNEYIIPNLLPIKNPYGEILDMFSKNAFENMLCLQFPNYYYRFLLNYLYNVSLINAAFSINKIWQHGILIIYNKPNSDKDAYKILITGTEEPGSKKNLIIKVDKGLQNKEIYKEILNIILVGSTVSISAENDQFRPLRPSFENKLEIRFSDSGPFVSYNDIINGLDAGQIQFNDYTFLFPEKSKIKAPKKVFLSYSHNNTIWMSKLKVHLSGFIQQKKIELWDDTNILPGDKWDNEIKENLAQADIFILLLTADFINSKYIISEELVKAIKDFEVRKASILPIFIEPFYLGSIPLVEGEKLTSFEILPKDNNQKLLAVSEWPNPNSAFEVIMRRLDELIAQKNQS